MSALNAGEGKAETRKIPIYIMNQENTAIGIFTVLMGGIVVPNVMLNLFFIAFGYEGVPELELLF